MQPPNKQRPRGVTGTRSAPEPVFSVVVPARNEALGILAMHRRLAAVMDGLGEAWEVVYVNDGSNDETLPLLDAERRRDRRIALLNLSRNFGKEIATTAGLDHARGEAVVVIDADLQDPPEVIPALVQAWREGYDVVYARRRTRSGDGWAKRATAAVFYRLMRNWGDVVLPPDVGDFRLMSRRVVDAVLLLRERHRFMKGLFAWVGFPSKSVFYDRAPRTAGRSQWTWWRLWNLAIEGITSFSVLPLKLATYLGLFVAAVAIAYAGVIVLRTLLHGNPVAGYPSLMAVMLFLGGTQLVTLGIIGEYLGRVFNESKARPLYIVERFLPSMPSVSVGATPSASTATSRTHGDRTPRAFPHFPGESPPRTLSDTGSRSEPVEGART